MVKINRYFKAIHQKILVVKHYFNYISKKQTKIVFAGVCYKVLYGYFSVFELLIIVTKSLQIKMLYFLTRVIFAI